MALRVLKTVAGWLDRITGWVVIMLLLCMITATSAGVFWRYGLNSALSWSEELSRYLLVWISFLGAAMATYRGSHIGISIVFDRLPSMVRTWLGRFVDILIILFMGAIMIGGLQILPTVHVRVAPTLSLHMDIPYLIMPVSAGMILFHVLVRLLSGFLEPGEG